jgi:GPH family glycoside/pentoside/hexuronide:cation symporter
MWGILQFAPRLFDAITDPLMGFISDNTKSKWGRRRQYVLIGGILMGISYIAMWQIYAENGLTYNFIYFLIWSLVFYLGLTIFSVPYVAMGYEMSDDFHERTQIMAIAQFIGQWAWVIAPWFWIILYDPEIYPKGADQGVRELSVWVAIACTLFAITPAIFIRSKSTMDRSDFVPINTANIGNSIKNIFITAFGAFKIKPFRRIAIATFLVFNSFQVIAPFTFLIIVHYLFGSDTTAAGYWPALHGSIGALITSFLVIPLITFVSRKIGKKKAFIVSQLVSVIGYVLFWFLFIPGKPYMFLYALPFHSFGIGSLFTIMMSMTADICDLDELENGTRREGVLGAVYWWMVKLGFGVAGLLSGLTLQFIGFDAENVTEFAIDGMRMFYTIIPIIGIFIAIYLMKDYEINEKRANEIKKLLNKK